MGVRGNIIVGGKPFRISALLAALVLSGVAGAWSADVAVERALSYFTRRALAATDPAAFDGTRELRWDSGTGKWMVVWYTGRDYWVGNDFDVSTISAYSSVKTYRTQSRLWPNGRWDGFRIGIYAMAGGVPGSIMWPTSGTPKFVMPTGSAYGWKDFDVNWVLPAVKEFLAAQEQFYDFPSPGGDPHIIDDNPAFLGHSWMCDATGWGPFESQYTIPYRNLMIRVVVEETLTVAPTSVGRVKALYY